jgi:hypothetical protein
MHMFRLVDADKLEFQLKMLGTCADADEHVEIK